MVQVLAGESREGKASERIQILMLTEKKKEKKKEIV